MRVVGSRVDGLALASQSRTLYYTDSHRNEIVLMSLDGTGRKVLRAQNLSSPRAIVVDERRGSASWQYSCYRNSVTYCVNDVESRHSHFHALNRHS